MRALILCAALLGLTACVPVDNGSPANAAPPPFEDCVTNPDGTVVCPVS